MKHFKISEFTCKCGCGNNLMDYNFLCMIDNARDIAQVPFKVTSGYRCISHNKKINGSSTSSHLKGLAADIKYSSEYQLVRMIYGLTKAGFTRIGINATSKFIHVDSDSSKPDAIFTY